MPDVDVLVVGGGPVGVAVGLLCARRGLRAAVVERSIAVHDLPRAIVMDDEAQRTLQWAGLAADLRGATTPVAGAEFVRPSGERIMGVELPPEADWPLGHHPVVAYHQPDLEALLRRAAVAAGVELRLGERVDGVGQDAAGAWADVVDADGARTRRPTRWLVAADGAASPIRKQLGIPFEDLGFDQDWLVVDARVRRPDVELPAVVQQICDPARPVTFVPGHGPYRRWEFQLQPGEALAGITDPARVRALLRPRVDPDDLELVRCVVYRFHATVAARMREGRIFLAGDAAHQMPPFLGQGLCAGLRDAANLAWKLEAVAAGSAGDRLLDSYDLERRPHAAGVAAHAVDAGRLIDRLSGRTEADVDDDAGYGGGRPFPHLDRGVLAGDHPLRGHQLPQPTVDGRPLDELLGDGWAVVARTGDDVPPALRSRWSAVGARVVVLDEARQPAPPVPDGDVVIVRPDRYVAAAAQGDTALAAMTDELLAWYRHPPT